MVSFAFALYRYGICFAMASNELDSFANDLNTCLHVKHKTFNVLEELKGYAKKKRTRTLGFQLGNLPQNINSRRYRSTKPVVAVLVMQLPI